jgi:DNA (cytosine-5)-methyltransferase 3A
MRVLSLFDGMGCGYIALKELGVNIETYYASEVDKYAIKMSSHLNPSVIHLGDVCNIDVSKLEPIDLLMGGSPCQSFSFAGKRKGMATKCSVEIYTLDKYLELKGSGFEFEGQSYLFWEYMRILTDIRKYNPDVKFLLENVEMGKKWERVLSEAVGVYGVHINSALVSAQSRKRIYWSNIRTKSVGIFGDLYTDIPQPEDRGILLRDVLESDVPDKYYLSDKMLNYFDSRAANFNNGKVNIRNQDDKATTLTASMASCDISDNFVLDTKLQVKSNQDKANCFTAGGNSGGLHSDMDLICVASRGRQDESGRWIQEYETNNTGKTNTITSVQKDNLVLQDFHIRRLTVRECGRLQTVPEHILDMMLSSGVSDTQLYRQFGNGWTIEVIKFILSHNNFS